MSHTCTLQQSSIAGPFGGVLPIGNVHPKALGYSVIAADVVAATLPANVPEPASWAILIAGIGAPGAVVRRRRTARSRPDPGLDLTSPP